MTYEYYIIEVVMGMLFLGQRVVVIGAGISGIGAAEVLKKNGANVILNDIKSVDVGEEPYANMAAQGIKLVFGDQSSRLLDGTDCVVASPGLSRDVPILQEALKRKIPVISEIEVAAQLCKAPILAITGTNGKTTTTTLLGEMVKATGKQVVVGGNIGASLSELVCSLPADGFAVAELSSYQLENTYTLKPKVAAILNLTPDHLQRHHTMGVYGKTKERIFMNQGPDDFTVLNYDDEYTRDMAKRSAGKVYFISSHYDLRQGALCKGDDLILRAAGKEFFVCHVSELLLFGRHNIENCLTAMMMAYLAGVDIQYIRKILMTFKGVEHRIEPVRMLHGVMYYNDSKGTNVDSSIKALEAFSGHIILIAGGFDKMNDITGFMELAAKKTDMLILIGASAERFQAAAEVAKVPCIQRASSLKEAVEMAHELSKPPQLVLLSPACSSFDMFDNYEQRGAIFKRYVNELEDK